ncbi:MAG: type II secretion system F family protein [Verrucomicrobiota bacterium]
MPILEVLHIVSQTVGNVIMEKAINVASSDIERGESISTALGKHPIFPNMIIRMITAGEQTGKIDNMLERILTLWTKNWRPRFRLDLAD